MKLEGNFIAIQVFAIKILSQQYYPIHINVIFVPIQSISRKGAIMSFHVDIS